MQLLCGMSVLQQMSLLMHFVKQFFSLLAVASGTVQVACNSLPTVIQIRARYMLLSWHIPPPPPLGKDDYCHEVGRIAG
jgi:hypothetical protein